MIRVLMILMVFCLFVQIGFGQETTTKKPLVLERNAFGDYLVYDATGSRLGFSELADVVKSNKEAYRAVSDARIMSGFGIGVGCVSGFCLGWELGAALTRQPVNWTMLGIGLGGLAVCVPLSVVANRRIKKGVEIYNSDLEGARPLFGQCELKLGATGDGVGLVVRW